MERHERTPQAEQLAHEFAIEVADWKQSRHLWYIQGKKGLEVIKDPERVYNFCDREDLVQDAILNKGFTFRHDSSKTIGRHAAEVRSIIYYRSESITRRDVGATTYLIDIWCPTHALMEAALGCVRMIRGLILPVFTTSGKEIPLNFPPFQNLTIEGSETGRFDFSAPNITEQTKKKSK